MSAEVSAQEQPVEQAQKAPAETAAENGDPSPKVPENGEEVKSKKTEKEEQGASSSSAGEQEVSDASTCSPLEEKIIRQIEVRLPSETRFQNMILPVFYYFEMCALNSFILEIEIYQRTSFCSRLWLQTTMDVR